MRLKSKCNTYLPITYVLRIKMYNALFLALISKKKLKIIHSILFIFVRRAVAHETASLHKFTNIS